MGKKIGKKAKKFARKNLLPELMRKRKLKSTYKKKASKKDGGVANEDQDVENSVQLSNKRIVEDDNLEDTSLDALLSEDESEDINDDDSGSDGYLSEDSCSISVVENDLHSSIGDSNNGNVISAQLKEIHMELVSKKKKLAKLKAKDPCFSQFLKSYSKNHGTCKNDETKYSDEDELPGSPGDGMELADDDMPKLKQGKLLITSSSVCSLCQLVTKENSVSAFTCLLNGFRYACHYSSDSSDNDLDSSWRIEDSTTVCNVLSFVLHEADNTFRRLLGVSSSDSKKESGSELKNHSNWKTFKPMIKSYLRSTLFLLSQVSDSKLLAFSISRLRVSLIFFAPFPTLLRKLIKISIRLWATGEGELSLYSSLIIQDMASFNRSKYIDICLSKAYKTFISCCKFVQPSLFEHIHFLRNSLVELFSQDAHKASIMAAVSVRKLANITQLGLRTKKKEAVNRICSLQYINCLDLWVTFLSKTLHDYNLQPLLYLVIQIVNGVIHLFPAPRYFPMRIKCIRWLNQLSCSSGIFIPIASLVLDMLEYNVGKTSGKLGTDVNFSFDVKLPKQWLKSQTFQELCVSTSLELLSSHFAQWSHHISFPELVTIPLIRLRKFDEMTTSESFRRMVKRFISQVEQNLDFVRKKRDEVAFSPNNQQSADSFLQLEKCSSSSSFTQYYRSMIEKASSKNPVISKKTRTLPQKRILSAG